MGIFCVLTYIKHTHAYAFMFVLGWCVACLSKHSILQSNYAAEASGSALIMECGDTSLACLMPLKIAAPLTERPQQRAPREGKSHILKDKPNCMDPDH